VLVSVPENKEPFFRLVTDQDGKPIGIGCRDAPTLTAVLSWHNQLDLGLERVTAARRRSHSERPERQRNETTRLHQEGHVVEWPLLLNVSAERV
jgi:hypothetical protein